jgi:K(+)-stimulated pyrophosphate-energized sodium pump
VTDNAQDIAEMSGDVEGEAAQARTHLDAIGNTTKAITRGIAIATAVLAATALFGSFRTQVTDALGGAGNTFGFPWRSRTSWSAPSSVPPSCSCSPAC